MILGIGTDIIEIDRIKEAVKKQSFLDKIFTKEEIKMLPGGNKICKILEKIKIYSRLLIHNF